MVEKCIVLGPIRQAFDYVLPQGAEILVCNFKDDAFFRFFGNAWLSAGSAVNPDELLHQNCFSALWLDLKQLENNDQRVQTILDFARPYLRERDGIAGQISDLQSTNFSPIKEVSRKNKLSERSVQINHKKHFGYTSKEFFRYERFLKAVQMVQKISCTDAKVDWFEVIDQCGYYDQSQLIKDFNHYLNLSPSKYLKFQAAICDPKN